VFYTPVIACGTLWSNSSQRKKMGVKQAMLERMGKKNILKWYGYA
jgi:hypothetical protein